MKFPNISTFLFAQKVNHFGNIFAHVSCLPCWCKVEIIRCQLIPIDGFYDPNNIRTKKGERKSVRKIKLTQTTDGTKKNSSSFFLFSDININKSSRHNNIGKSILYEIIVIVSIKCTPSPFSFCLFVCFFLSVHLLLRLVELSWVELGWAVFYYV